jgi:hypothetical protein
MPLSPVPATWLSHDLPGPCGIHPAERHAWVRPSRSRTYSLGMHMHDLMRKYHMQLFDGTCAWSSSRRCRTWMQVVALPPRILSAWGTWASTLELEAALPCYKKTSGLDHTIQIAVYVCRKEIQATNLVLWPVLARINKDEASGDTRRHSGCSRRPRSSAARRR